jgi:hypothetical protein
VSSISADALRRAHKMNQLGDQQKQGSIFKYVRKAGTGVTAAPKATPKTSQPACTSNHTHTPPASARALPRSPEPLPPRVLPSDSLTPVVCCGVLCLSADFDLDLDAQLDDLVSGSGVSSSSSSAMSAPPSGFRSGARVLATPGTGTGTAARLGALGRMRPLLSAPRRLSYSTPRRAEGAGEDDYMDNNGGGGGYDDGDFEDLPREGGKPGDAAGTGGDAGASTSTSTAGSSAVSRPKSRFAKQQTAVKTIAAAVPQAASAGGRAGLLGDRPEITVVGLEATADSDPYAISVSTAAAPSQVGWGRDKGEGGRGGGSLWCLRIDGLGWSGEDWKTA